MILFFAHIFASTQQRDLVYIIVFVTGVGDGLAEPVSVECCCDICHHPDLDVVLSGGSGGVGPYTWKCIQYLGTRIAEGSINAL